MKYFLDPAPRASRPFIAWRIAFGAMALVSLLAACGQKGPLYMPVRPAPLATPPATATPAGIPPAAPSAPVPASGASASPNR